MKAVSNVVRFLPLLFMLWLPLQLPAQEPEYKEWDSHDVKGLYVEVENEDDADIEEDGRYFQKYRRLSSDVYEIEVSEKVSSKLWKIKGSKIFILFRYNPFLFKYDEGILEWNGYGGTFYEKP
ncbi:MAG TPA: hypothetical protein H9814_09710 [Candidatus Bacteroides merdigallinarum]|uniref:DUF3244 domain-containing protein n=1 Tax=Candidatus Bacteroides merdigallinarum TaxID=2838473 RepID=A0A9D2EAI0_9BACE|nr:hypothetical protein [Candidatus Bacteroides merdigallinarum]